MTLHDLEDIENGYVPPRMKDAENVDERKALLYQDVFSELALIEKQVDVASKELSELCHGDRRWTMHIPWQPDDSDAVFGDVIRGCRNLIEAIRSKPKNKLTRRKVYEIIDTERYYQDLLWNERTTPSKGIHSPEEVIVYMEDYLNEAKHIMSRENQAIAYPMALSIMRKVLALGVRLLEQYGCEPRVIPAEKEVKQRAGLSE